MFTHCINCSFENFDLNFDFLIQNNHGIDEFMQPMSAVAPSIKKSTQIVKKDNRVSEAQNQDIMNNLLGELDKNNEDDLQEIGQAMAGVLD